jgi:hypothetical protein
MEDLRRNVINNKLVWVVRVGQRNTPLSEIQIHITLQM